MGEGCPTLGVMSLTPKQQIRRRALQAVIDRRFGGIQARFSAATGRSTGQISVLLAGKKGLGENLARELELILKLEPGELDREPESVDYDFAAAVRRGYGVATACGGGDRISQFVEFQERYLRAAFDKMIAAASSEPRRSSRSRVADTAIRDAADLLHQLQDSLVAGAKVDVMALTIDGVPEAAACRHVINAATHEIDTAKDVLDAVTRAQALRP